MYIAASSSVCIMFLNATLLNAHVVGRQSSKDIRNNYRKPGSIYTTPSQDLQFVLALFSHYKQVNELLVSLAYA